MPAASEAVGSPGGGGGGGDVELPFQIRNDEGFVYKVPRGLYPDAAPSTTTQSAAGPDRKAAGLRRRRRALLRLRDKRLRDLSRWEALASELLGPLEDPQLPASSPDAAASTCSAPDAAGSTCSAPVAASSSSSTCFLDALLRQVDLQAELMKKLQEWCDDANAVCDAQEAAIFDSVVPSLPSWGCNPSDLMIGLCSPPADRDLDEQNGRPEASGVSPPAAMASLCTMSSPAKKNQKIGHDLPPILTESRLRKRVNLSGTNDSSQASVEPRSKRASGSTSIPPNTPGTRKKTKSTLGRAPFILASPGALTRRRAAYKNESP